MWGNDGDINKLKETTHYAGAADFERPRFLLPRRVSHTLPPPDAIVPYLTEAGFGDTVPLRDFTFDNSLISALVERWRSETHTFHLPWGEVVPYGDVGVVGAAPRRQASRGSTTSGSEKGVVHDEACVATGSCPPDAPDRRSRDPPTVRQVLYHVTDQRVSDDQQVQQSGAPSLATIAPGLCEVQSIFLGLGCAGLDVSVPFFGGSMRRHGYRWLHSVVDVLDLLEISPVVSTRQRRLPVSAGCEVRNVFLCI
ncbi:uncharacterized protein DS421_5g145070 [Arachis hypogaea]|nr:uncharacterized protein DS421_5g145070 [Arachis hypogaea]